MIRTEAGMSTSRFCALFDVPERSWRRYQAQQRGSAPTPGTKGPWPQPVRTAARETVAAEAAKHPAWGHRKVWAMARHAGADVSQATVLRLLRDEGLILPAAYQKERRDLATRRKAAFAAPPTGPNQVWQLDFSDYETATGGLWKLAGCRDYWSKYEHDVHTSPTANQYDAIEAIELALAEAAALFGAPIEPRVNVETGELEPVLTIVTDNGGPFRSFRFEAFIAAHPELRHVRTRVRTPGQNGSRERGFGSMKYEWLYREDIRDGLELVAAVNAYRQDYNYVRPHEALAFNRPFDVHTGRAGRDIPTFQTKESLPTT